MTTIENTVFRQLNEQELTFVSGGILGITLNKKLTPDDSDDVSSSAFCQQTSGEIVGKRCVNRVLRQWYSWERYFMFLLINY
jgi:hypothetical protein